MEFLPGKNQSYRKNIKKRGFSFQSFLLLIIIPLTLLTLVVSFGSQTLHYEAMRSLVADRDLIAVRAASSSIERELTHRSATILMVASGLSTNFDLSNLIIGSDELITTFDGGIAIYNPSGKLISSTNSADYWAEMYIVSPSFFDLINKSPTSPVFSSLIITPGGVSELNLVGVKIFNGKILVGAFSPSSIIQDTISNSFSSGKTLVQVVSPGEPSENFHVLFLFGPTLPEEDQKLHPGFQEALNGESGINFHKTSTGEHVIAFSPIHPIGWGIVTEEVWEEIASPYLRTTQAAPLIMVPIILLSILALWIGNRRIVQPLQALENQASELAKGNFVAIRKPVDGIMEIRNLQDELIDMTNELRSAQNSLRSYIGAITTSVEQERHNIARELHDDTIQNLIALNQRIQLAQQYQTSKSEKETLDELNKKVLQLIVDLRRVVQGLRPIYLEDFGISSALEMLAKESTKTGKIPIKFSLIGKEKRYKPEIELALYRISQETISNIQRHSHAKEGALTLDVSKSEGKLIIHDDGKGFTLPDSNADLSDHGHFGLLGIKERADLIKANLRISSSPGEGTTIIIYFGKK